MFGIDLNRPIVYKHSSLRFFAEGEHHISRVCRDDVLLLVYDGVLRFSEDGKPYEIHAGEYHIQHHDSVQEGPLSSDAPKYLYVHFSAHWEENDTALPPNGLFEYTRLKTAMEEMNRLSHGNFPYIVQTGKFYELLSALYQRKSTDSAADKMADYIAYIAGHCRHPLSLEMLCREFHFSRNHVINLFKKAFGMTPIAYINSVRLQEAEYLMEVTSDSLESIALQCGYPNYSHFYKLFSRKHGQSPERWRAQLRTRSGA